jgi:hypothetical protein
MKAHVRNFHQQVAVELCCRYPAVRKKERKKDRQIDVSSCTMNKLSSEEALQLLSTIPNKSNCMKKKKKKKKKLRHWMHQQQQCNGEWI